MLLEILRIFIILDCMHLLLDVSSSVIASIMIKTKLNILLIILKISIKKWNPIFPIAYENVKFDHYKIIVSFVFIF